MYIPHYFKVEEVLPPYLAKFWGETGFQFIDDRVLITLDNLRKIFGPVIVNDYAFGGVNEWRGLRTTMSPYYRALSQHSFGRAMDCKFAYITAQAVRMAILNDIDNPMFKHINAMESKVSWLHFDTRNTNRIQMFNS